MEEFTSLYDHDGPNTNLNDTDNRKRKADGDNVFGDVAWENISRRPRHSVFDNDIGQEDGFHNMGARAPDTSNIGVDDIFDNDDISYGEDMSEFGRRLGDDMFSANNSEYHSEDIGSSSGNNNHMGRNARGQNNGNKRQKRDQMALAHKFSGDEFDRFQDLAGEKIEYDPNEVKQLVKYDKRIDDNLKRGTAARIENEEDDDVSIFKDTRNDNYTVVDHTCPICRYSGTTEPDNNKGATNAYYRMMEYDLRKYGLIPDKQLYKDMRDIFNREQSRVRRSGGEAFFVTVFDVAQHMIRHTISNPMRVPGNQIRFCQELLERTRSMVVGKVQTDDGSTRSHLNADNLKMCTALMKHQLLCNRDFMFWRSQANLNYQASQGRGQGNQSKSSGGIRHVNTSKNNQSLR